MTPFLTGLIALFCLAAAALLAVRLATTHIRLADLRRLEGLLEIRAERSLRPSEKSESRLPSFLEQKLARAGWEPSQRHLMAAGAIMLFAVLAAQAVAGLLAGMLTAATLVLLIWVVLEYRAGVRIQRLSDCMLGFLERMRQLLSVGNSLSVALERAVEHSPLIVTQCLTPTLRRIANGSGVAESLERVAAEMDLYELHLLATATRTNLRFGGSMTAILRNIIENIRRRASIERELRANTTQIRASAWVLALLPVLVATLVMLTNRDYSSWFLATEKGHHMIAYAVVSQIAGALCMRMITRSRY
ncbi:MAG: type II secretion system F family protein [Rhizomicrobium sp.]